MTSPNTEPETRPAPRSAADAEASPRYAWSVVVLLLFAYALSFLDRQILTLMVGPIRASLGISDTQFSLLHGLAFALFYTLLGLPLGRLMDRVNRRNVIVLAIAGWSVMTVACGFARNFFQLFLARMGVGIGEAGLSPGAYSLIADYFPRHRVARALSVYGLGIPFGIGTALLLGGYLVDTATHIGNVNILGVGPFEPWQLVFLVVGAPGIVYAGLLFVIREPVRRDTIAGGSVVPARQVVQFVSERRRLFVCLLLGLAVHTALNHGTLGWVPAFFDRVHGWSPGRVGFWLGLSYLSFGTLGMYSGGLLTERFDRQGREDGSVRATVVGAVGCLPFAALAPLMSSPWMSLLLYAGFQFFAMMPWGAASAAFQIVAPNEMRGQVSALYLFSINLIGLGMGPTMTALLTDYAFGGGTGVRYSLVTMAVVLLPISAGLLIASLEPFRRAAIQARDWSRRE